MARDACNDVYLRHGGSSYQSDLKTVFVVLAKTSFLEDGTHNKNLIDERKSRRLYIFDMEKWSFFWKFVMCISISLGGLSQ